MTDKKDLTALEKYRDGLMKQIYDVDRERAEATNRALDLNDEIYKKQRRISWADKVVKEINLTLEINKEVAKSRDLGKYCDSLKKHLVEVEKEIEELKRNQKE